MPLGCRLLVYLCRVLKQTNKRIFWGGLTGDLLSLGTVQALGALLPLATVPHLLRVVGLESFGWYNLSLALMNFGVAWVDYGFTLTGSRDKSAIDAHQASLDAHLRTTDAHLRTTDAHQTTTDAHLRTTDAHQAGLRETGQKQSNASQLLFSRYFFTQLLLLGIGLPVLVLLVMGIPSWRANAWFFFFSALLLPAQIFMPAWWLQGSRQFALLARWQVLGRLLFALGVFVLIDSPDDQLLLPLLNGGCMLLVSIAAFFQVTYTHKISLQWPGLASCRALLRVNRPVFVGGLSSAFYAHSTLIVLELFAGVRWVGLISTLEKITLVFRMAANSFQQVLIPRLSAFVSVAPLNAAKYLRKLVLPVATLGFLGSIFLWVMGPQLLSLVAGQPQPEAGALLRWLALLPPILALGVLPSSLLLATKNNFLFGRNLTTAAAVAVGVHLLLVPYYGAWATITSLIAAELLLLWRNLASMKHALVGKNNQVAHEG